MFENLGHELDEMRVVVDDGVIDSASNIADGTFPTHDALLARGLMGRV